MFTKIKTLAAAAAVAGAMGATTGSANALTINIGIGPGSGFSPHACRYVYRPGVSRFAVRAKLRARGFRAIRNIRFVPGHRVGLFRCKPGKFVSVARKGFFNYRVKSTARSGRPYQARRIGGYGPGPFPGIASPYRVKQKLFFQGYRFINVVGVRFRFGRRVYVSFARKFGRKFVIYSNIRTGRPFYRRVVV
jgi:hypothetical protein